MTTPSISKLKVAFIGAGPTNREHLRAFQGLPGIELAGIHSRGLEKARALAAEFSLPFVAASVAELYDKTRADLVVMAVPELSIGPVAEAILSHPWAALMEKPPGHTWQEALHIQQLASSQSRRVFVALNRRHLSSVTTALGDLDQRDEPRFIRVEDQQSLDVARQIGHPETVVQNWMYANSIHLIDTLRHFGRGPVSHVHIIRPWTPEKPGIVVAAIEFASGDTGLYEGIWNGPGPWTVTVNTPSRRWELRPLEQARHVSAGERKLVDVPVSPLDQEFKPGFRRQAEQVVLALRGQPHESPTLDQAMESMDLVHRIFEV